MARFILKYDWFFVHFFYVKLPYFLKFMYLHKGSLSAKKNITFINFVKVLEFP